jgi:hypothetical protein
MINAKQLRYLHLPSYNNTFLLNKILNSQEKRCLLLSLCMIGNYLNIGWYSHGLELCEAMISSMLESNCNAVDALIFSLSLYGSLLHHLGYYEDSLIISNIINNYQNVFLRELEKQISDIPRIFYAPFNSSIFESCIALIYSQGTNYALHKSLNLLPNSKRISFDERKRASYIKSLILLRQNKKKEALANIQLSLQNIEGIAFGVSCRYYLQKAKCLMANNQFDAALVILNKIERKAFLEYKNYPSCWRDRIINIRLEQLMAFSKKKDCKKINDTVQSIYNFILPLFKEEPYRYLDSVSRFLEIVKADSQNKRNLYVRKVLSKERIINQLKIDKKVKYRRVCVQKIKLLIKDTDIASYANTSVYKVLNFKSVPEDRQTIDNDSLFEFHTESYAGFGRKDDISSEQKVRAMQEYIRCNRNLLTTHEKLEVYRDIVSFLNCNRMIVSKKNTP